MYNKSCLCIMQKRRPRAKNSLQNYSDTHERFPTKAKNIHNSKGQSFKQSYSKLQRNDEYCDNTSCLKKDAFGSLESLFDLKKPMNLSDAFPFAFHYHKQKLIKTSNATKSEPFVKAFLQSFSSQTNLEPFVFKAVIMLLYSIAFNSPIIRLLIRSYILE